MEFTILLSVFTALGIPVTTWGLFRALKKLKTVNLNDQESWVQVHQALQEVDHGGYDGPTKTTYKTIK